MPPLQRFTKEDVLKAAFLIVREQGIENLNARNIAKALNSSTQPIFSFFESMKDLKTEVFRMAERYHAGIYSSVEIGEGLLANIWLAYIRFAIDEPNLFRLQYMSNEYSGRGFLEFFDDEGDECCNSHVQEGIQKIYGDNEATWNMFFDMWLYAHGVASVLIGNQLHIKADEITHKIEQMADLLENKYIRRIV
jgi:AcrR family transcriptional regulator